MSLPMRSDIAIAVKNLTKTYRVFGHPGDRIKQALTFGRVRFHQEFTALQNASFEIKKGEVLGIIGRNGSGKSTLLQLICGILRPTGGEAQVNGRISALLELGTGFNPEFTGRENVYFQGAVMGISRDAMERRFDDIAAFADIGEFIDQPVRTYSSGMYVKLAFAAAIHADPGILIVDEALAVGDALFQAKCFAKFREFKEQGVTILFVTHDLDLVTSHCDSAVLLDRGVLVTRGTPKEVVDDYRRRLSLTGARAKGSTTRGADGDSPEWPSQFVHNPAENRYGSGSAEILNAGLFSAEGEPSQILMRNAPFSVRLRIRAHERIESPIVSFVVKDVKGTVLCGTTTLMQRLDLGTLESGEDLIVSFRQVMRLNSGTYLLSLGCQTLGKEGYMPYDVRLDHMAFEVVSEEHRPGIFDPESSIEWHRPNRGRQKDGATQ